MVTLFEILAMACKLSLIPAYVFSRKKNDLTLSDESWLLTILIFIGLICGAKLMYLLGFFTLGLNSKFPILFQMYLAVVTMQFTGFFAFHYFQKSPIKYKLLSIFSQIFILALPVMYVMMTIMHEPIFVSYGTIETFTGNILDCYRYPISESFHTLLIATYSCTLGLLLLVFFEFLNQDSFVLKVFYILLLLVIGLKIVAHVLTEFVMLQWVADLLRGPLFLWLSISLIKGSFVYVRDIPK